MSKDKTFLALKNIIHNELGITRSEIMEMVRDCIHEVVERQVQSALKNHPYTMNDRLTMAMDKRAEQMANTSKYLVNEKLIKYIGQKVLEQVDVRIEPK